MPAPSDLIELPFLRLALVELTLLGIAGGLLGTWIVLRRLAFFTHAVGSVAFPALVFAGAIGVSPQAAGLAAGTAYAAGVGGTARARRDPAAATALLLVAALALGVVLASDVIESPATVDRLLFGTVLGLSTGDLALSAGAAVVAAVGALVGGRVWLAAGFDDATAPPLSAASRMVEASLPLLIAIAAVAAVPAVGALLITALFIVPAVTARLLTRSVGAMTAVAVAVAVVQALVGLYLAYVLDISPGPAIAVLGAALCAVVAIGRRSQR